VKQHLSQQEIQKAGLSVQTPSSTNNDTLEIATVMQQIITELSDKSQKDKVMVNTKLVHNLMKENGC
jgi:prophage antirepressor-like protein